MEAALLDTARAGDEAAFARLIEPYRGQLHAHCYRMLGSVHDAEDALQEVSLRAWRGLARFEGRSSLKSWLYTIATNTCLNQIERRPKRVLPVDYTGAADPHGGPGAPVVESVWIEPYPDELIGVEDELAGPEARYEQRESVELAFVAALQLLPPNQRAALIMREVLGFSAQETADALETSVASVNSALQRARKTVEERAPEQSQQATLRELGDERVREIVERYLDAWERNDVDTVMEILAEDASFTMPPLASWFGGEESIRIFLSGWPLSGTWRWRPITTTRERPARARVLHLGRRRAGVHAVRPERAHLPRRADQRRWTPSWRAPRTSPTASPTRAGPTSRSTPRACTRRSRASGCRSD